MKVKKIIRKNVSGLCQTSEKATKEALVKNTKEKSTA